MEKIVEKVSLSGAIVSGKFFSWEDIGISKEVSSFESGWLEFDNWAYDKWGRDYWENGFRRELTECILAWQEGVTIPEAVGLSLSEKVIKYGEEITSATLKKGWNKEVWYNGPDPEVFSTSQLVSKSSGVRVEILIDFNALNGLVVFQVEGKYIKEEKGAGKPPRFFSLSPEKAKALGISEDDSDLTCFALDIDLMRIKSIEEKGKLLESGYEVIYEYTNPTTEGKQQTAESADNKMTTIIDLSLKNVSLYEGCEIVEEAGRLTLKTSAAEAIAQIGRNLEGMELGGESVTLTGPMAVFAYLVVFRHVANRFDKVFYHDGRNEPVLVASNA